MRSAIRVVLLATALVCVASQARAQGFYWSLAYEPSVPIGGIRNATPNVSPAGASLGVRYLFTKQWSLGLGSTWNNFAENFPRATYPIDNGALTGAIFRQVWVGTLLAQAHVYFNPDGAIGPYVGIGAGLAWLSNQALVSDLPVDLLTHGFVVSPEVGLLIPFDRDAFEPQRTAMQSASLGVRYTYTTAESRDVTSATFLAVTLGVLIY
jgi:hypothetical protein